MFECDFSIVKSNSTGNINLRDRRIKNNMLDSKSFKLPNISIPNSSLTLVSFVAERDVHTPEVSMNFTVGGSSLLQQDYDDNNYQTKETRF